MNPMSIMDIDLGIKESPRTTQKSIPVGVEISKLSIWANFEPLEASRGPKKVFWESFKTINLMSIMDIELGSKESPITTQKNHPSRCRDIKTLNLGQF